MGKPDVALKVIQVDCKHQGVSGGARVESIGR